MRASRNVLAVSIGLLTMATCGRGADMGNTGEGTTTDNISSGSGSYINASRFLAASSFTATNIKAKVLGITGKYKCAIYSDNVGVPQTLLMGTAEAVNPSTGWQTFTLTSSQAIQSGSYYWLAIWSDLHSTSAGIYYDASGGSTRWTDALTYGAWPNQITTTGGSDARYCIYAEGPAGPTNPPPTISTPAWADPSPVTLPAGATVHVVAGDPNGDAITYAWSKVSGPGTAAFAAPTGTTSAVSFSAAGTYVLRVTVDDGHGGMASSEVTVVVKDPDLRITGFGRSSGVPGEFILRWQSVSNHRYTVQAATNLVSGFNENLRTNILAIPPENVHTDNVQGVGMRFYRVKEEPIRGARGRVVVASNGAFNYNTGIYDTQAPGKTVFSDQGTLLRGLTFWCFTANHPAQLAWAQNFDAWRAIPRGGFNAVRLGLYHWDTPEWSWDRWLAQIDQWVNWGEQLGIYVMLESHEVGGHNQSRLRELWSRLAPRYAQRTHVIFEIANEPVGWQVADYTAQDVADFQEIHDLIRRSAPETHVVFFSFAVSGRGMDTLADQLTGVDWTRASVAYHGYWATDSRPITQLKSHYPTMNSEWMANTGGMPETWNDMDGFGWQSELLEKRLKVSWFNWEGNCLPWSWSLVDAMLAHARANGYAWTPDVFPTVP